MSTNNLKASNPTGKFALVVNQPTKVAYGPFDSLQQASQWLANRLKEHTYDNVYTEIVPMATPVLDQAL